MRPTRRREREEHQRVKREGEGSDDADGGESNVADHTILFYNVADALVATTLASLASFQPRGGEVGYLVAISPARAKCNCLFQIRTLFSPRGEKEYRNLMEYDATGGGFVALWLVFAADGENEAGTFSRRRRGRRKARALEDTRCILVASTTTVMVATITGWLQVLLRASRRPSAQLPFAADDSGCRPGGRQAWSVVSKRVWRLATPPAETTKPQLVADYVTLAG